MPETETETETEITNFLILGVAAVSVLDSLMAAVNALTIKYVVGRFEPLNSNKLESKKGSVRRITYCAASVYPLLKKFFCFKNLLATSGIVVSKLDAGLSVTPGITGAIDPSPFYLLPSYKSCEDLARMAKNADYYRGSWPSYLKYKLYKEWEIQEMEAYKSKINNLLNSSPLENNYISDNL